MIKISHESPLCLLEQSRNYNDYDYALVHLFEQHLEYYNFFEKSLQMNREVILDNSIFELGQTFNPDDFAKYIIKLKPTYYIIPDTFNDMEKTIDQLNEWNKKYLNLPGIKIGVVHGKSYKEMIECYKFMKENVDKIAFNYADDFYVECLNSKDLNVYERITKGRITLLNKLYEDNIIDVNKSHHILGVALPQEVKAYKNYKWIESVDTSNPIVHAIKNIKYEEQGLTSKENIKLVELIEIPKEHINLDILYYNIDMFRQFANGE
jgi:hypothetical protein